MKSDLGSFDTRGQMTPTLTGHVIFQSCRAFVLFANQLADYSAFGRTGGGDPERRWSEK